LGHGSKGWLLDDTPKAIQTNKVTHKNKKNKKKKKKKKEEKPTCTHIQVVLWNIITPNVRLPNTLLGGGINPTHLQTKNQN